MEKFGNGLMKNWSKMAKYVKNLTYDFKFDIRKNPVFTGFVGIFMSFLNILLINIEKNYYLKTN